MSRFTALMITQPWIGVLIVILAMYSITRLITEDTIVEDQRNWFFDRFPHEGYTTRNRPKRGVWQIVSGGQYYVTEGTKLGELVHCPWCSGFYVALGICAGLFFWPMVTLAVLAPMALRVVAGLIGSYVNR